MTRPTRTERDSMGDVQVPADALWGAQTQRAVDNFHFSERPMPRVFLRALGLVKQACARSNAQLGLLPQSIAEAISTAAGQVADGQLDAHFPVDVFQTGSGTSSNMNANEVISAVASAALGHTVHPNDHVNMCQSSNDVIPTCIHLAATLEIHAKLLPALLHLQHIITAKAATHAATIKTGRTHLMDALPLTVEQEMSAWAAQIGDCVTRIHDVLPRLTRLAIGGTAVGSGINAPTDFGASVARELSKQCAIEFVASDNHFRDLACQDTAVELSGQLRTAAVALMKIANDLRWMNSGPLAGLGEIRLPTLQPGSSIMPAKVNPVIPEAVAMVCARVMGNDTTVALAGQSGNFQLNVMLPVLADALLDSILLLSAAARSLADQAISGLEVDEERVRNALSRNPILVTALNSVIGYDKGAAIAKQAYAQGRPVLDVALECSGLDEAQLRKLLDPERLTRGGVAG
ncbi:MAG: fumarate hydratase class II [Gammaproteobacteria bacterium]|jgi:fumarate hydratase class II